jgi:hypothetical protein
VRQPKLPAASLLISGPKLRATRFARDRIHACRVDPSCVGSHRDHRRLLNSSSYVSAIICDGREIKVPLPAVAMRDNSHFKTAHTSHVEIATTEHALRLICQARRSPPLQSQYVFLRETTHLQICNPAIRFVLSACDWLCLPLTLSCDVHHENVIASLFPQRHWDFQAPLRFRKRNGTHKLRKTPRPWQ